MCFWTELMRRSQRERSLRSLTLVKPKQIRRQSRDRSRVWTFREMPTGRSPRKSLTVQPNIIQSAVTFGDLLKGFVSGSDWVWDSSTIQITDWIDSLITVCPSVCFPLLQQTITTIIDKKQNVERTYFFYCEQILHCMT